MSRVWQIEGIDSTTVIYRAEMPANLSEAEIKVVLQRLVSGHLDSDEIIAASLRKGMRGYRSLLERIGRGSPITVGENPYFTARLVQK